MAAAAFGLAIAICGAGVLLALATIPFVLRVPRGQNRRLAAVLALEAVTLVGFGNAAYVSLSRIGLPYVNPSQWSQDVSALLIASLVSVYLFFVATLETPIVRWLRSRVALVLLLAYPIAMYALKLSYTEDFAARPDTRDLVGFFGTMGVLIASNVFCLVAAIDAFRRAVPGSVQRDRAKAFALAFGTRDAMLAIVLVTWFTLGFGPDRAASDFAWEWIAVVGVPLTFLVYLALLAHGILRTQLFDIDVRVQRTLVASIVVGAFVVAFFLAEQIGQALISERAGPFVGIAGSGALALAFAPLRRVARRAARRIAPADTSDDAVLARKLQVYRGAAEAAFQDGGVNAKERADLTKLGADLALTPRQMAEIEDAVVAVR